VHTLHPTSSVASGASNSPRVQVHEIWSVPATATTLVQRPDAIVREKGGVGGSVGVWRNGRKEKKEEAILFTPKEISVFQLLL
jgi:hypothetical protein